MWKGSEARRRYWEEKYLLWKESGLSQTAFCKQEDLNVHTFRYWLAKFETLKKYNSNHFLPVQVKEEEEKSSSSALNLVVGELFRIEVADDFKEDTLRRLLSALS